MSVTDVATAQHELKVALYEVAKTIFADDPVRVSFGYPGSGRDHDDLIVFTELETGQVPGPLGTNRARDEDIDVTVEISSFRAGFAEDDLVPAAAVTDYLRRLEQYVRVTDTTLGGRCQRCFVTRTVSGGIADPAVLAQGRLILLEATFTARVRITN